MKPIIILKAITATVLLAGALSVASSGSVSAHVTVKPAEVPTSSYQTFTVNVPNEEDIPTNKVSVVIPAGVTSVTPTKKPGWQISVDSKADNKTASATTITWSGGLIEEGLRDEFTFSAKTPSEEGVLHWKAYQTYTDGTVVSWDKDTADANSSHNSNDANSGPFSVTNVISSNNPSEDGAATQNDPDTQATADRALYVAIAALLVSFIGIFIASRRK